MAQPSQVPQPLLLAVSIQLGNQPPPLRAATFCILTLPKPQCTAVLQQSLKDASTATHLNATIIKCRSKLTSQDSFFAIASSMYWCLSWRILVVTSPQTFTVRLPLLPGGSTPVGGDSQAPIKPIFQPKQPN